MYDRPVIHLPDVPGIDFQFRPASYFWPLKLETHLLTCIKGAQRNASLKQFIAAEELQTLPACMARSALSDAERLALGRIHPDFMGGEYLPDLLQTEVQIARITIASTTQDVTCLYARRGKNRIRYRVVDEYAGATLCGRPTRTSLRPLTLGALEAFFNGAWSIYNVLAMNFAGSGYDPDDLRRFVVGVESEFYPQIGALYRRRIEIWGAARRASFAFQCAR